MTYTPRPNRGQRLREGTTDDCKTIKVVWFADRRMRSNTTFREFGADCPCGRAVVVLSIDTKNPAAQIGRQSKCPACAMPIITESRLEALLTLAALVNTKDAVFEALRESVL